MRLAAGCAQNCKYQPDATFKVTVEKRQMSDNHLYDNAMYTHTDVYRFEPDEMKCNDSLLHNPNWPGTFISQ